MENRPLGNMARNDANELRGSASHCGFILTSKLNKMRDDKTKDLQRVVLYGVIGLVFGIGSYLIMDLTDSSPTNRLICLLLLFIAWVNAAIAGYYVEKVF